MFRDMYVKIYYDNMQIASQVTMIISDVFCFLFGCNLQQIKLPINKRYTNWKSTVTINSCHRLIKKKRHTTCLFQKTAAAAGLLEPYIIHTSYLIHHTYGLFQKHCPQSMHIAYIRYLKLLKLTYFIYIYLNYCFYILPDNDYVQFIEMGRTTWKIVTGKSLWTWYVILDQTTIAC